MAALEALRGDEDMSGVADDLRDLREKADNLTERLVKLETTMALGSKLSHDDRAQIRAEVVKVGTRLDAIEERIGAAINQAKGAGLLGRRLGAPPGVLALWISWAAGLLQSVLPFLNPPR